MRFILSTRNLILVNRTYKIDEYCSSLFKKRIPTALDHHGSSHRSHCSLLNDNNLPSKNFYLLKFENIRGTSAIFIRNNSTTTTSNTTKHVIDLTTTNEPRPSVNSSANDSLQTLLNTDLLSNAVLETSVASLNLGSNYTPVGWCVHYLDFLHSVFPWWGSIAVGTLILRLCLFPFVISAQRSASKLNEILPEQAILKEKMNQARITGDSMEFARLSNESMTMYKRKGINPFKVMLAPFAQAPVFITFFVTLRRMANYPVESLKTGGLFWFTDLSIPDPTYALPLITCTTLWITLETSFRSGLNPNQTPLIKYGARVIPLVTLAFTFQFPSAIMMYWCTNNFISLAQVHLLKVPAVREFLSIPQIKVNPQQLDINKKSFKQHFSETIENAKINRMMEERKTLDEITFKKAGVGPLQKTYRQDPTRFQQQNQ